MRLHVLCIDLNDRSLLYDLFMQWRVNRYRQRQVCTVRCHVCRSPIMRLCIWGSLAPWRDMYIKIGDKILATHTRPSTQNPEQLQSNVNKFQFYCSVWRFPSERRVSLYENKLYFIFQTVAVVIVRKTNGYFVFKESLYLLSSEEY